MMTSRFSLRPDIYQILRLAYTHVLKVVLGCLGFYNCFGTRCYVHRRTCCKKMC